MNRGTHILGKGVEPHNHPGKFSPAFVVIGPKRQHLARVMRLKSSDKK